jgi:hypothetical protein
MTRKRLLAVALVTLMPPISVWTRQSGTATNVSADGKTVLHKIYDEDQKNRNDMAGDARRREQVRRLMAEGKVQTGEDYYYAAFIFQHGQKPADYLLAHILAVTAVSKGFHGAIWLSAASLDRYLHSIKQPQVFGTQFGSMFDSSDDQGAYDKDLISDGMRAEWCVKPIAVQAEILAATRAGKEFQSTRMCPLP